VTVVMPAIVSERLVDDAIDAYVSWRERRVEVWETYERWNTGPPIDRDGAFVAYQTALDREELAAAGYADCVMKVTTSLAAGT
jgi:hypothetical protein